MEFADVIDEARQDLGRLPEIADAPRRRGARHGSNPRGRLTAAKNSGRFWTDRLKLAHHYMTFVNPSDQFAYRIPNPTAGFVS
jgi:hypothetical protein